MRNIERRLTFFKANLMLATAHFPQGEDLFQCFKFYVAS